MKKVLLCWELGGGIGYTGWLVEIARALKERGCEPVLALRELIPCVHQFAYLGIPVVAAPVAPGRRSAQIRREGFHPCSFADLMAANGFGAPHELHALVRAWRGLIDLVKPDLIVGAYCPVLAVAAYRRVPLAFIGYGYTVPPADQATFPMLRDDREPYANQTDLLTMMRRVQEAVGGPVAERLTDPYRGDAHFILSFSELDPYGKERQEPLIGPLEDLGEVTPPPASPCFYAYLVGGQPYLNKVVDGLVGSGLPGAIYMRNPTMTPPKELDRHGVRWLNRPPSLQEMLPKASVIVHHGGANTAHAALGAGRTQVLIPRNYDQVLTARQVQQMNVGAFLARNTPVGRICQIVQQLASDAETQRRVSDYAQLVRSRGQHNALPQIVEDCLNCLA